jgi:carboxylate-amine ligase
VTSTTELRERFGGGSLYTVGIEDEVMVLEPGTFELAPRAGEVLALTEDDPRFKPELPASQIEIMTNPCQRVADAGAELLEARCELERRADGLVRFGAAGFHPFSPAIGPLSDSPRYRSLGDAYRCIAGRELVCALHIHVSAGGPDRSLAVYNAARSYLPLLAALAANAPYFEGLDTGLASVRPKVATLLPRQGVAPVIASFEELAGALAWGSSTQMFPESMWWWELRLHHQFGTLEFRVPDAQSTVSEAVAIASVIQALVAWLGTRHDGGATLPVHPSWMIEENRWMACRDGLEGEMGDFDFARRRRTRDMLAELVGELEPFARDLGASLEGVRSMINTNGALLQREVVAREGVKGLGRWLSERFIAPPSG